MPHSSSDQQGPLRRASPCRALQADAAGIVRFGVGGHSRISRLAAEEQAAALPGQGAEEGLNK